MASPNDKPRNHDISSLRAQIVRLRIPIDGGDRYFIPQNLLVGLMTKERVHKAISACAEIETYQVGELVDIVLKGAIKVFAILVLLKGEEGLILRFVETDGFQKTALDARLPLHRSQIEALVPQETAGDFFDIQWEFVAPFFSKAIIHRVMPPATRLPFVLDADTSNEGGFGHIYEIQIHTEHHEFSLSMGSKECPRLVRKEFLPNSSDQGDSKVSEEGLKTLLIKMVPLLNHNMGVDYCSAVHNCLAWDTTINGAAQPDDARMTEEESIACLLKFQQLVVEPIRRCSLGEKSLDHLTQNAPIQFCEPIGSSPRPPATGPGEFGTCPPSENFTSSESTSPSVDTLRPQKVDSSLAIGTPNPNLSSFDHPTSVVHSQPISSESASPSVDTPRPQRVDSSLAIDTPNPNLSSFDTPRPQRVDSSLAIGTTLPNLPGFDHPTGVFQSQSISDTRSDFLVNAFSREDLHENTSPVLNNNSLGIYNRDTLAAMMEEERERNDTT